MRRAQWDPLPCPNSHCFQRTQKRRISADADAASAEILIDHIDHAIQESLPEAPRLHELLQQLIAVRLHLRKLLRADLVLAEFCPFRKRGKLLRDLVLCESAEISDVPVIHDRAAVGRAVQQLGSSPGKAHHAIQKP